MSGAVLLRLLLAASTAVVCTQLIRGRTPAVATAVSVTAVLVLTAILLPELQSIKAAYQSVFEKIGLQNNLFIPVVKVIGITQISHITAELCRDAGERAIAAKLEFCGAAASLLCVLPLAEQALELIGALGT